MTTRMENPITTKEGKIIPDDNPEKTNWQQLKNYSLNDHTIDNPDDMTLQMTYLILSVKLLSIIYQLFFQPDSHYSTAAFHYWRWFKLVIENLKSWNCYHGCQMAENTAEKLKTGPPPKKKMSLADRIGGRKCKTFGKRGRKYNCNS
jgi:hypothetical protein